MAVAFTYAQYGTGPAVVGVDTSTGVAEFTVPLPNADASLLVKAFAALSDGSIIAPDFAAGGGSVDLDLIHIAVDGTPTSIATGLTGTPRWYLGGYQAGSDVFIAIMTSSGAQLVKLAASTLAVTDSAFVGGFNNSCAFVRGDDAGILMVGIEAKVIAHADLSVATSHWIDEDDWTGYDASYTSMQAYGVLCEGGVLYNDLLVFSNDNGNTIRVITARDATTLARTGLVEVKSDANNDYWGGSVLAVDGGNLVCVASTPSGKWRALPITLSTFTVGSPVDTSIPVGADYVHPVGPASELDGALYVGVDVSSTAAVSAAAVITLSNLTVDFHAVGTIEVSSGWYEVLGPVALAASTTPPPGAPLDPRDRLRSSLSEDLGSLLDAVEVIPVDAGFEIAFTNAVTLEPAVRSNFRELFRATDSAEVDFLFYPRPRQNTVMEDQFDGLTLLSRLDRWFPPRTYGATATFGLGATATAQAVVAYVLAQWATLQPWLTTKPVPDLRMPTRGLLPSEYTASDGLVQTATITIEQDPERPASALDVLHDLLSPFPGAIVRQDSDGDLVIVPRYGPDADEAPIVTLRTIDLYSVSTGKPDPFATINRATFASSGGLTSTNDVPVMQPAWFQLGPNHRLSNAAGWFTPPVDRTNLQPPRGASDTLQEDLTFGQFGSQKPILWEASPSVIPAGGGIRLEDSSHDPMITSAYRIFGPAGGLAGSGAGTVTILTATIPFTGAWVDAFKWTADIYFVTMRARWVEASRSVEWAIGGNALDGNCWQGCWTCIVEFTLNDSSVAYARGANVTATFGAVGDSLPSATGNAVAESQAALGVIERTVNVSGYELDAATLAAAAEGFVRANITPRMTREIELAVAAQDVTFDRVGRLIELPSGEVGVLVGLTYRDDFTTPPGAWAKTARVQLLDGAAPGAVDDQLDFLTLTNGSILATTAGDPLVLTEV